MDCCMPSSLYTSLLLYRQVVRQNSIKHNSDTDILMRTKFSDNHKIAQISKDVRIKYANVNLFVCMLVGVFLNFQRICMLCTISSYTSLLYLRYDCFSRCFGSGIGYTAPRFYSNPNPLSLLTSPWPYKPFILALTLSL